MRGGVSCPTCLRDDQLAFVHAGETVSGVGVAHSAGETVADGDVVAGEVVAAAVAVL